MPVETSEFPKWVNEVLCRTAEDEADVKAADTKPEEKTKKTNKEASKDVNSANDSQ